MRRSMMTAIKQPLKCNFMHVATKNVAAITHTFTSVPFGNVAGRLVIVCVGGHFNGAVTINAVTIGGVGATLAGVVATAATNTAISAIYYAIVPTGTTGTVAVTFSQSAAQCIINVYSLYGSIKTPFTTKTASQTTGTTVPLTMASSLAGQVAIASCATRPASTYTWSGVTEDTDTTVTPLSLSSGHATLTSNAQAIVATLNAARASETGSAVTFASN